MRNDKIMCNDRIMCHDVKKNVYIVALYVMIHVPRGTLQKKTDGGHNYFSISFHCYHYQEDTPLHHTAI